MAKYDHGGGCPCGLQKVCDCKPTPEELRDRVMSQTLDTRDASAVLKIARELSPEAWARLYKVLNE